MQTDAGMNLEPGRGFYATVIAEQEIDT